MIVSNVSWRWIFFVNVPIGIVALFPPGGGSPTTNHASPTASTCWGSSCSPLA